MRAPKQARKAPGGSEAGGVHFPVMNNAEVARLSLSFNNSSDPGFGSQLREVLRANGVAIVTDVLTQGECRELEEVWECEQRSLTPQQGHVDMCAAHGELAWRSRLHAHVKRVFADIFETSPDRLAAGSDKVFSSPKDSAPQNKNHQWLHVDQNHRTGLTHLCYQGVLYLWPSHEQSSTTAL